jgi:hypothetical protein
MMLMLLAGAAPAGQKSNNDARKRPAVLTDEEKEIIDNREMLENLDLLRNFDKFRYFDLFVENEPKKETPPAKPAAKKDERKEK